MDAQLAGSTGMEIALRGCLRAVMNTSLGKQRALHGRESQWERTAITQVEVFWRLRINTGFENKVWLDTRAICGILRGVTSPHPFRSYDNLSIRTVK